MSEPIYVCLTSYPKRIDNVPRVLDTILNQTVQVDGIILTLAVEDAALRRVVRDIPKVSVCVVEEDTRVWKKFLPASKRLPDNALIVPIDDDCLYPPTMIEEMLKVHREHPDAPISGNHYSFRGLKCHCGNASMVQKKHFVGWERYYHLWKTVHSSDIFYTMLAKKNGYEYVPTPHDYQHDVEKYNEGERYTIKGQVKRGWDAVAKEFNW